MLKTTPDHPIRSAAAPFASGLLCLLVASCTTYKPLPLDHATARAESPADWNAIRKAALEIQHPLLKPITIQPDQPFSPDEIAVIAVVANPALRALRDQRGIAKAQVMQAGLLPNPQVGYSLDKPRGNADPTLVTGTSLGVDWDLYSLLTRGDSVTAARQGAKAVDLEIAWQEWQTAQAARLSAFRILSLNRQIAIATQIERELGAQAHRLEIAARHQEVSQVDVATVSDAAMRARGDRLDLEQQLRTERTALNLALGVPSGAVVRLRPASAFPGLTHPALRLSELLKGLDKRRPDLLALQAGFASEDASLRGEIKRQFPRFNVGIHRGNDTSNIKSVGFSVSIELPVFDRNQAGVAAAEATRRQLFDDYSARVAEARAEVTQIFADLDATRQHLKAADADLPRYAHLAAAASIALHEQELTAADAGTATLLFALHRLEVARLQEGEIELGVALETVSARALLNREP